MVLLDKKPGKVVAVLALLCLSVCSFAQNQFIPLFPAQKNGQWGVADINGSPYQQRSSRDTVWAVPPVYDSLLLFQDFCHGYYMGVKNGSYVMIRSKKDVRQGRYKSDEIKYNEAITTFRELHKYVFLRSASGKWCAYLPMEYCSHISFTGFIYDSVYSTIEKDIRNTNIPVVWVVKEGQEYFLEDGKITPKRYYGKTVARSPVWLATGNPNYTREIYFTGLNNKWGVDTKTSTLVDPEYDEIIYTDPLTKKLITRHFILRKDREWFVFNLDSNKIIGNKALELNIYNNEYIARQQDGFWHYRGQLYDSVIIYEDQAKSFYFGAKGALAVTAVGTADSVKKLYYDYYFKELPPIQPLRSTLIMRDISDEGHIIYSNKNGKWGIKAAGKGNPDLLFADFDYIETYRYKKAPGDTFNIPNDALGFYVMKGKEYLNILPGQLKDPSQQLTCITYCNYCLGIGNIAEGFAHTTGGETKEGTYAVTVTSSYKTFDKRSQSWLTTNQVYKKYSYKTPEKVVHSTVYHPCKPCHATGRIKKFLKWNRDHYEIIQAR